MSSFNVLYQRFHSLYIIYRRFHIFVPLPLSLSLQSFDTSTTSCSNSGIKAEKCVSAPPYGSRSREYSMPPPPSSNSKQLYYTKPTQVSNSRTLRTNPHNHARPQEMHEDSYRVETRRQPSSLLRSDCTDRYKKAISTSPCLYSLPCQHKPSARTPVKTVAVHIHLTPNVSALRRTSTYCAVKNSPTALNANRRKLSGKNTNRTPSSTSIPKENFYSIIPDLDLLCYEAKRHSTISADSNAPLVGRKPIITHTTQRRNYSKSCVSTGASYGKLNAGK